MPGLRILIASTPVGPLGSGMGGGVELTLQSIVLGLSGRGHDVEVVAPAGSLPVGSQIHLIAGALQPSAQNEPRDAPITLRAGSVLAAMWEFVGRHQHEYDLVLNMAYDWLPFYMTPFLGVPVAHLVSMGSLTDAMDAAIESAVRARSDTVAVHSRAQAETFPRIAGQLCVVGNGIPVERYEFRVSADEPGHLGFVGRISPEKGIADVFAASAATGAPVKVWGLMQDERCWAGAAAAHPGARVTYEGFLPTEELQAAIGGCRAVLMTSKWVEAFGNVAMEALACGVPVIAYRRGGPAEIVTDGRTGFLVEPDDVDGLARAIGRLDELARIDCRRRAEQEFSTDAFAARVESWLRAIVGQPRVAH